MCDRHFVGNVFTDYITDGIPFVGDSIFRRYIGWKYKKKLLPTDRARQKKKVSRLEYTDGKYSVGVM